jgi:hypothetical protein
VVADHQADQNAFAALTDFVNDVQHEAASGSGSSAAADSAPSHLLRNVLIAASIVVVLALLGFFLIARPIRERRQQELKEAKSAAQDDLIALSTAVTDHDANAAILAAGDLQPVPSEYRCLSPDPVCVQHPGLRTRTGNRRRARGAAGSPSPWSHGHT